MNNHLFCRVLLQQTMVDVRKVFSSDEIRRAWAWGDGRRAGHRSFEFHGPNGEYDYNLRMADCKWSALGEGWRRLLDAQEPERQAAGQPISDEGVGESR
jgi:hypothetical protein